MDIKVKTAGSITTIYLNGLFNENACSNLKTSFESLVQQNDITILDINLSEVVSIDSSALGMLLLLRERSQAKGKDVVLSHPNHTVSQILKTANFGKLFTIR